jgi:hypothetical protein
MKRAIFTTVLVGLASLYSCAQETDPNANPNPITPVITTQQDNTSGARKKIKLAILLDTSNSMDGLINQAKNQLWKIVNQLAKAKDEYGEDPDIEIAIYQYGNDDLSVYTGYVEQIQAFTTELDLISEKLFALTTHGGSEYCGTVIKTSLQELSWSDDRGDLQLIFIAGNEPFTQGDVPFELACGMANQQNVVVNTIFCGNYNEGARTGWKDGAVLGQGRYMNIDRDAKTIHYTSPYDKQISQLNIQLNQTYIPYGSQGSFKKEKQIQQDRAAESLGSGNATKRAISKSSKVYKNTTWDLVDAAEEESFDMNKVEEQYLPAEMKGMSGTEKDAYVAKHKAERDKIKKNISELNKKREAHIAKQRAAEAGGANQLDDAIIGAILEQAEQKNFSFE